MSQPQVFKAREVFKRDRLKIKPPKPKSWSHDDDLAEAKGKSVSLFLLNREEPINGVLLEADKFALKLVSDNQSILTFYKHAIESYGIASE